MLGRAYLRETTPISIANTQSTTDTVPVKETIPLGAVPTSRRGSPGKFIMLRAKCLRVRKIYVYSMMRPRASTMRYVD